MNIEKSSFHSRLHVTSQGDSLIIKIFIAQCIMIALFNLIIFFYMPSDNQSFKQLGQG